ncbi:MAG: teichoic acid transporter, partial [Rhizobacter sp.]|nr:teichoic acid transporter [Rhizobacter sp.]
MSDLASGTLINLLSRIAAVSCGLVITLITARLGTEPQGQFALFVAVEAVLLAACSGLGIALARRVSHLGQSPAGLVSATVLACVGLGGVLGVVLWLGARLLGGAYAPLWLLASVLPLALITPNLTGLWLGQGRMGPIAGLTVSAPLLTLLGMAGAVLAGVPFSVMTVLIAWVLARLLVSVASVAAATGSGWAAPE